MEAMKGFPDKYFDLAVVDPPYGIGRDGRQEQRAGMVEGRRTILKVGIPVVRKRVFSMNCAGFQKIKSSGARIILRSFASIDGVDFFGIKGQKFATAMESLHRFSKRHLGLSNTRLGTLLEGTIHPTQKPIALYKWLLTNYAKPGDKILDTHLGSGSSR